LVNPPDIWILIGLVVFWFIGMIVEREVGKARFAGLLAAMAIVPGIVAGLLDLANQGSGHWAAYTYGVDLISIALIFVYGVHELHAREFLLGIPLWVLGAAYVFIEILRDVGNRAWAQLILALLVIAVGFIGGRQCGLLEDLEFIPRSKLLGWNGQPAGAGGGWYDPPTKPGRQKDQGRKRGRRRKGKAKGGPPGAVVAGPWGAAALTPLEQAELDVLLDRISAGGTDSLSKEEKSRLDFLSRRMRDR
jgi:hypothetical protein